MGGGSGFGDDDDNSEEEGPSYFGFVKDTNGATMPDVKVTVAVKDRGGIVTRTDALGAYKVPGFGKDISPEEVTVACEKQGYRQARVLRRGLPPPGSKNPGRDRLHAAADLGRAVRPRLRRRVIFPPAYTARLIPSARALPI